MRLPRPAALAAAVVIGSTTIALADARPFTFVYDAYPHGPQGFEYEQYVTYKTAKEADANFNRFEFRHEFEFGLAENFDLAVYVANWSYEDSDERSSAEYDSASLETIFYVTDPVTDGVGIGLYNEIGGGPDEIEFEQKLIVHKDVGPWTLAYNLVIETELEDVFEKDEETEVDGVLGHAFGVSYALSDRWRVGAEATVESEYERWSHFEGWHAYAGPNVSYQSDRWYATVTPQFQLTNEDDEPDFVLRTIVGVEF